MLVEHPYRQDGNRPIFSDDAEVAAIQALALRKRRLDVLSLVTGAGLSAVLFLSIVVGFLCWFCAPGVFLALDHSVLGWMIGGLFDLQSRLFAHGPPDDGYPMTTFLVVAALPLLISRLAFRIALRNRRRLWIAEASSNSGVPAERLEWVLQRGRRVRSPQDHGYSGRA